MLGVNQDMKDSFYEAILSEGANMQKTASENDLIAALENSDLSEEELNKLASDLEDALNDLDDVDEGEDTEGLDDVDDVDDVDEGEDTGDDEGDTDADESEDTDADADEGEDDEIEDIESLAAAYEEAYEKYASEGRTVRDYVYDQVDDAEFAAVVGDMAEKLAYVADLPVFMVADDLMTTISQKISAAEEQEA